MTKKLFTLLLAVAASVGTMFAWDYERVQIGDLYYNLDAASQTAEVTSQNSGYPKWSTTITTANIPSSVEYNSMTYTVISIGDDAFYGCSGLTSVTIPNNVTSIGESAFRYGSGFTSVTIPGSVTSIGSYAFESCTGLTSMTIPNSVISIGGVAFSKCTGLTSVTIGNSVTSIGDYAFAFCSGLTSVNIPNSVTSIGNYAFEFCIGLTSVNIPNSVTSIGDKAFNGCSGLTSPVYNAHVFAFMPTSYSGAYTIPDGIESIAGGAFSLCSGLTSVTIPNSVTSIGYAAFEGCGSLTSVTIGNSVTSIGNYAFCNCIGLTSMTIPNSVTTIGYYAFQSCCGLTSIICEATTPPTLGSNVFYIVDKSIPLYVPAESIEAYQTANQWKDFTNIIGLDDGNEEESNIRYIDPSNNELGSETVSLHLPDVPEIEGFTFLKWQVVAGDLEEGIIIQAVYQADESTSASSVYTNPANPAQKLIRNGNVYILSNEKTYSITGQEVK